MTVVVLHISPYCLEGSEFPNKYDLMICVTIFRAIWLRFKDKLPWTISIEEAQWEGYLGDVDNYECI